MPRSKDIQHNPRALLTHQLLVLSNTLGKGAMRLYASKYGISLAEWRLLSALVASEPATVNGLADALGTDKGWISRTTAALVAKGLVTTQHVPSDGRSFYIMITTAGRALYQRILPATLERHRKLVSVLSEQELKIFESLLGRLQAQAESIAAAAGPASERGKTASSRARAGTQERKPKAAQAAKRHV